MIKENFIKLYENSFHENWDLPCYTDYGDNISYTYGQVAEEIARLHLLFKHCSLRRGDKIAVIGKNNARWCIAYMATITYGAIIVPILQDFNPSDVHHIVNHSESVFLFTSDSIWEIWKKKNSQDFVEYFLYQTSAVYISGMEKPYRNSSNIWMKRCITPIPKDSTAKTYNIPRFPMTR